MCEQAYNNRPITCVGRVGQLAFLLTFEHPAKQGRRWVFGARGSNFGRGLPEEWKSPSVVQVQSPGRAPGGGLEAKAPEVAETLQIEPVSKVFYEPHVVSKRR